MTTLATEPIRLPFKTNEQGVILVGDTRVTLDTLVHAFKEGASAEQIVHQYPALALDDVYLAIAYYLRNVGAVESYLRERRAVRESVKQETERRFDPAGIRDRLMARPPGRADRE